MTSGLSDELVEAAMAGDKIAVNKIVSIYEPYINTLAAHKIYDRNGNEYIGVDVDLQGGLQQKLIEATMKFAIM